MDRTVRVSVPVLIVALLHSTCALTESQVHSRSHRQHSERLHPRRSLWPDHNVALERQGESVTWPLSEEERTVEVNRRFSRHLRILFAGRQLSSTVVGEGAPWARRLVCEPGCLHGGICQLDPKTKEPMCLCPLPDPGTGVYFRGRSCQTEAKRCNSTWWCENGGTCLKLDNSPPGEERFACSCPTKYQGAKCQTPVTTCGSGDTDLWCANGGMCVFSAEANGTICNCPSTHAGTNCETLVEPQDLGPPHHSPSNFTSPVILPPDSAVVLLEEEQQRYFKAFFLIFGVFLTIWLTALAVVHCPRPRSELKRRLAAMRGELAPLRGSKLPKGPSLLHKVKVVERLPSQRGDMLKPTEKPPLEAAPSGDAPCRGGRTASAVEEQRRDPGSASGCDGYTPHDRPHPADSPSRVPPDPAAVSHEGEACESASSLAETRAVVPMTEVLL